MWNSSNIDKIQKKIIQEKAKISVGKSERWYYLGEMIQQQQENIFYKSLSFIALKFPPHFVFWKNQDWTLLKGTDFDTSSENNHA